MASHKIKISRNQFKNLRKGIQYLEMIDDRKIYNVNDTLVIREYVQFFFGFYLRRKKATILKFKRVHHLEGQPLTISFKIQL
jgi:hypothetical protein